MDAVEFLVTRDRMCKSFNGRCNGCEVNERMSVDDMCIYYMAQHPQEVVEIIERWGKEHPLKTRQNELLKLFPRVSMSADGAITFCPKSMDSAFVCPIKERDKYDPECGGCRKKYWLEEMKEYVRREEN